MKVCTDMKTPLKVNQNHAVKKKKHVAYKAYKMEETKLGKKRGNTAQLLTAE